MHEKHIPPAIEALAALAVFALLALCGRYLPLLLLLLPLPAMVGVARLGAPWGLALAAACVIVCWALLGSVWIPVAMCCVVIALVGGWTVRCKWGAYDSVALCCGGWTLALGLLVGYIYLTTGADPLTWIMQLVEQAIGQDTSATLMLYGIEAGQEMALGSLDMNAFFLRMMDYDQIVAYLRQDAQMQMLRAYIGQIVPVVAVNAAALGGLLSFLLARVLCKARGQRVGYVPGFDQFILPKNASVYFVITYVLVLVVVMLEVESLLLAATILYNLLALVFRIQGLSLVDYLMRKRIRQRPLRVFVLVLCALILPTILTWVGLFEQVFRVREKKILG